LWRVTVKAEVRPTEDFEKVKKALLNFFTPERIEHVKEGDYDYIVGYAKSLESLSKLHEALRRERILDAARKIFKSNTVGNLLIFSINKQAAYRGRVSFVTTPAESPLGAITFIVEYEDIWKVIDWLAPKTERGKPLWEHEVPK